MESFTMGTRLHAAARLVVGQFGDSDLVVLGFYSDNTGIPQFPRFRFPRFSICRGL